MKLRTVLISLALLVGCRQAERVETFATDKEALFQLCRRPFLPVGLSLKLSLDTLPQGQLQLHLQLKNSSKESIQLQLSEAVLLTEAGRRQAPLVQEPAAVSVAAGESQDLRLQYTPINDLFLYQRTGLPGAIDRQYLLPLHFVAGLEDTLAFCFPEDKYLAYRAKAALEKPQLYRLAPYVLEPQTAARQADYLTQLTDSTAASAYFSEQELFSGGINLHQALWSVGDSLYLKLRLINHAPQVLQLQPEEIRLMAGNEVLNPARTALPEGSQAETAAPLVVRKGERLPLMLVYDLPQTADSLLLQLRGIQFFDLQEPVYREDFLFLKE